MSMMRLWPARRLPLPAAPTAPAEADLLRHARRGDRDAYGELVRLHQDRMYRLAARMVGADAAEDVAQQAFVKAWLALDRFHGAAAFGTWLYRIAMNLCLDELRRTARFRPLPLDGVERSLGDGSDVADSVIEQMEGDSRRRALAWALDQIPSEDRLLLHLRVGEERSYGEIAALLDLNPRTVGTRLYRARARLHALLVQQLEDGDGLR
jgi:RNA polymerase sigma-70 factor (ECF subfamily)